MIRQATITAILPDDRLRLSFKPNPDETIEVVVERPAYADVKGDSHVDIDWDRERGVTRLLLPSPQTAVSLTLATVVDQSMYWVVRYDEGRYAGTRDTVSVGTAATHVKLGDKVRVARAGEYDARIVEVVAEPDEDDSEPSFDIRVRMALGVNPLASEADVLDAIRDHKMLAECEREILAALGMPETNTVRDVADAVAELRRELGIDANATWSEIVSAARDTEESWEAVQRERAYLCKALGITEGSSFAALLAEVTNNITIVSMQGKAMREAVRDLRQWMGVRGEEIAETDLPDEVDRLRRELLRCSGAHVRGSRSIVDGLREVAAEAYANKIKHERTRFAVATDSAIIDFATTVDTQASPCSVVVSVGASGRASEVLRALLNTIEHTHRPCRVRLSLRSPEGTCEMDFTASPVPGEEGWS